MRLNVFLVYCKKKIVDFLRLFENVKSLQNVQVQNNKSGRYVKNPAAVNGNANHRIISRKTFDMSNKQMPENRRPIMQVKILNYIIVY